METISILANTVRPSDNPDLPESLHYHFSAKNSGQMSLSMYLLIGINFSWVELHAVRPGSDGISLALRGPFTMTMMEDQGITVDPARHSGST